MMGWRGADHASRTICGRQDWWVAPFLRRNDSRKGLQAQTRRETRGCEAWAPGREGHGRRAPLLKGRSWGRTPPAVVPSNTEGLAAMGWHGRNLGPIAAGWAGPSGTYCTDAAPSLIHAVLTAWLCCHAVERGGWMVSRGLALSSSSSLSSSSVVVCRRYYVV